MVPNLVVLNQYLYAKKEFLLVEVLENRVFFTGFGGRIFTFESNVLVDGFVPLIFSYIFFDVVHTCTFFQWLTIATIYIYTSAKQL